MKAVLQDLFTSKKFLVTLAGIIVAGVARLGLNVDPNTVLAFLGFVSTYVLGQAVADQGKEAATINLKAAQLRFATLTREPNTTVITTGVMP